MSISHGRPRSLLVDYPKVLGRVFLAPAPFLPMSRDEMDLLGWDSLRHHNHCHGSDALCGITRPFGMAIIGSALLEAPGLSCGDHSRRTGKSKCLYSQLGKPNLFFGVAPAIGFDGSTITADRKIRSDECLHPSG